MLCLRKNLLWPYSKDAFLNYALQSWQVVCLYHKMQNALSFYTNRLDYCVFLRSGCFNRPSSIHSRKMCFAVPSSKLCIGSTEILHRQILHRHNTVNVAVLCIARQTCSQVACAYWTMFLQEYKTCIFDDC